MASNRINTFGGKTHATPFQISRKRDTQYQGSINQTVFQTVTSSVTGYPESVTVYDLSGNLTGFNAFSYSGSSLYIHGGRAYYDLSQTGALSANELVTKAYVDSVSGGGSTGGGISVNPITGSSSGVLVFVGANSASGFADFQYDDSIKKVSTVSASLSAIQLHRSDQQYIANNVNSVVRHGTERNLIFDAPYFDRTYKSYGFSKYAGSTGTNIWFTNSTYSLWNYTWGSQSANTTHANYSYVNYKTVGTTNSQAGYNTAFGLKSKYLRQLTTAIATGPVTNCRYYIGFVSNTAIMGFDLPSTYPAIAFRAISSSANWTAYTSDGVNKTIIDTGVSFDPYTEYVFRIQIDSGYGASFYINNIHVATITTTSPDASVDLYTLCRVVTTSNSTKDVNISHVDVIHY